MKINTLCILGGGTSGFMTTSVLAKYREQSGLDFDIKLIQSGDIGSIGVGESTLFNVNELFAYLGLKDSDWMRSCNATYKTAIRFEDFYKQGRYFYYPFGPSRPDANIEQWFTVKEFYPNKYTPEKAALYFNSQSIMNEENKLCDVNNFLRDYSAYHFDSRLLGKYLREYSEKKGVEVVDDTFIEAKLNEDGSIKSLVCEKDIYEADLFVDCSGFESLLLGQTLKEEFSSFNDTLINNKALVAKIPYTDQNKQLKNYTNCVALKNGWCWEIPLWDKMSVGYVHTNKFATEEEIEKEFFDHVGEEVEYRTIHFKTGRYKKGWVKNVVAVGLSYGFLEPLESTGIATTFHNIFRLLECLSKRDMYCIQVDRDLFNHSISSQTDAYRTFVEMHYYLSSREDSQYWKFVTEGIDYESIGYSCFLDNLIVNRNLSHTTLDSNGNTCFTGPLFIVAGMNYSCYSKPFTLKNSHKKVMDQYCEMFDNYFEGLKSFVKSYQSSYKYLKRNIYSDPGKGF